MRITEAAHAFGANLICFDGGILAPPDAAEAAANALYDLVSPDAVDGLIIWSSVLDWIVHEAQTEAFCRRFSPLPVITVGRALPASPACSLTTTRGCATQFVT